MNKVIEALFLIIISSNVFAQGWHDVGNVTRVHSGHGNGIMYLSTSTQIAVEGCTVNNAGYTYSEAATNSDKIYSLLLSAYVSKKPVTIYVTGQCLSNRSEINAVQYKDDGVSP